MAVCRTAGIPAALSCLAGNHLCNQMLDTTRHLVAEGDSEMRYGIVHLPLTPEMVAAEPLETQMRPSMALAPIIAAGRIAVQTLLEGLTGAETRS